MFYGLRSTSTHTRLNLQRAYGINLGKATRPRTTNFSALRFREGKFNMLIHL